VNGGSSQFFLEDRQLMGANRARLRERREFFPRGSTRRLEKVQRLTQKKGKEEASTQHCGS